ncbi:MAG: hypothetical protein V4490_07775 [Pseudomonadota bacterium]
MMAPQTRARVKTKTLAEIHTLLSRLSAVRDDFQFVYQLIVEDTGNFLSLRDGMRPLYANPHSEDYFIIETDLHIIAQFTIVPPIKSDDTNEQLNAYRDALHIKLSILEEAFGFYLMLSDQKKIFPESFDAFIAPLRAPPSVPDNSDGHDERRKFVQCILGPLGGARIALLQRIFDRRLPLAYEAWQRKQSGQSVVPPYKQEVTTVTNDTTSMPHTVPELKEALLIVICKLNATKEALRLAYRALMPHVSDQTERDVITQNVSAIITSAKFDDLVINTDDITILQASLTMLRYRLTEIMEQDPFRLALHGHTQQPQPPQAAAVRSQAPQNPPYLPSMSQHGAADKVPSTHKPSEKPSQTHCI